MSTETVIEQDLKFPIGRYKAPTSIGPAEREAWIAKMASLPENLRQAVEGLNDAQLDTPYREGGWTVRQVVHHLPDSHLNSYTRFRMALTEDSPVIRPYNEAAWAELSDAKQAPIQPSLDLLRALHARFVLLLQSMNEDAFARGLEHPQLGRVRLDWMLGLYAWHSEHHVAHIQRLRSRKNW